MDFFEHQERAKQHTGRLVALFGLALFAIFCAMYALATLVHLGGERYLPTPSGPGGPIDLARLGLTAAFTGLLVGGGSALRMAQLRSGGRSVAEALDGHRLIDGSEGLAERRLLNVVEELAIASGCGVPEVYVLEREPGINAFAAGWGQGDAVIGITRGALEALDRDELRGVIGHELSHILNGDMRLNLRLIGLLHGILFLSLFGRTLLNSGRTGWVASSRRKEGSPVLLLGVGLLVIGSIGVFFGRLIQAAVSRQRELLADASAAQFTRDPEALARALEKIEQLGSGLRHPRGGEVAHMLLGRGAERTWSAGWFDTHPPIPERIARLRGRPAGATRRTLGGATSAGGTSAVLGGQGGVASLGGSSGAPAASKMPRGAAWLPGLAPGRPAEQGWEFSVGAMHPAAVELSRSLLDRLSPRIRAAAHDPLGAQALVLGLLFNPDSVPDRAAMDRLLAHGDPGLVAELGALTPELALLDPRQCLPVFDLCLPAIRAASAAQYGGFRALLFALSQQDGWLTPLELAMRATLVARLDPHFGRAPRSTPGSLELDQVPEAAALVCGVFAQLGGGLRGQRQAAYESALGVLELPAPGPLLGTTALLSGFEGALDRLGQLGARPKRRLLDALWTLILRDGELDARESECLRAVSERLACPLSPLLSAPRAEVGPAPSPASEPNFN